MTTVVDVATRPFRAADGRAVQQLHAWSFTVMAAGSYGGADIHAYVRTLLAPGYVDELLVCHLVVAIGSARIRKVFVGPGQARRGLATALVTDAEERARRAGHQRFVLRANLNAIPLYQRLGYTLGQPDEMAAADGARLPVRWMAKG